MKKIVACLFVFLIFGCKTFDDTVAINSDYSQGIENVKHNLDNNRINLFEAYVHSLKLLSRYQAELEESDATADTSKIDKTAKYLSELQHSMMEQMQENVTNKKYEDALRYALSLQAINITTAVDDIDEVNSTIGEIYTKLLEEDLTADYFTKNAIKYEMLDRKILPTEELFNLLQSHATRNSKGEFMYLYEKYRQTYPDLLTKYPQLQTDLENLATYSRRDFNTMLNSIVMVVLDKGMNVKNGMGYIDKSLGTGFFIDENGYILTNHHVIADHVDTQYKGYSRIYVTMRDDPNAEIPATVVGYDKVFDIALLKIAKHDTPPLVLGHSADMQLGDKVYAIGNPIGLKNTITSGIISSTDVEFFQLGKAFQIDAAVNPGNSGGPLVDEDGQVIAIVFAGIPTYQGLNFAIPFRWVMNSIPNLYKGGEVKRAWIGAGIYADNGIVEVHYVMPDGSAANAGIQVGDQIVSIDGENVSTVEEAQEHLSWKRYPMLLDMEICRDGTNIHKTVLLQQRPYLPIEEIFKQDVQRKIIALAFGIELDYYKKNIGSRKFTVTKVYRGMAGYQAGVQVGEPLTVYDVKYVEKEGAIVLTCSFKNAETNTIERIISIPVAAELNCLL